MIAVLSLALEDRKRAGDRNQKAKAQNFNEWVIHASSFFKKYQIYRKIVKEVYVFYKLSLFEDWEALRITI